MCSVTKERMSLQHLPHVLVLKLVLGHLLLSQLQIHFAVTAISERNEGGGDYRALITTVIQIKNINKLNYV